MNHAKELGPVTITIFGGTGDLAQKKLFPALFHLYKKGFLNEKFHIVGFSRKPWDDAQFQEFVREIFMKKPDIYDTLTVEAFLTHVHYVSGNITEPATYTALQEKLGALDVAENTCLNKVFYLAVTPAYYETTLRTISDVGLTIPCAHVASHDNTEWTRVFIEKPFGNDLEGAQKLDKLLGTLFDESQVFRIDHYLTKETLQNILNFRFSNTIFEPIWNKDYIKKITIRLIENNVVGQRGESYDPVGALRDVGQNHILQMLALVTMEKPSQFDAQAVRTAREHVLEHIAYHHSAESLVRAQYRGYTNESGVAKDSDTETFFRVTVALENERFAGVPIILESGKGFDTASTQIYIEFKPLDDTPCTIDCTDEQLRHNTLTFSIQPDEYIALGIFVKKSGFENVVIPQELKLGAYAHEPEPEAYERVLYDGLRGDHTLFTSTKEVLAEWRLITEIVAHYKETKLQSYPIGSESREIGA
jgi:glucose-6-phosphate 1-dehydrogenase